MSSHPLPTQQPSKTVQTSKFHHIPNHLFATVKSTAWRLDPMDPERPERKTVLTAVSFTLLSIYLPSLIHVVQPAPGPLHHEVKYGLYRR